MDVNVPQAGVEIHVITVSCRKKRGLVPLHLHLVLSYIYMDNIITFIVRDSSIFKISKTELLVAFL